MDKYEYIKWSWKYIDDGNPVIMFYEIDLDNERYATRMIDVFPDKSVIPFIEEGWKFVTEGPVPTVEEIKFHEYICLMRRIRMKKYEIKYHIADLCESNNGWKKEINVIQINNREPIYEIRSWNENHTQMGDGITLTPNEMRLLKNICESMDFQSIDGSRYEAH